MKIVYVVEKLSGVGGMERILIDKMNWLVEHTDCDVTLLLCWKDTEPLAYHLSEKVKVEHLNVRQLPKGATFPIVLWKYNNKIRKLAPNVTVFAWVLGAFLAVYGHRRGRTIYEQHASPSNMTHEWLQRKVYGCVDHVVSLTHAAAEYSPKYAWKSVVISNFTRLRAETLSKDYSAKHCICVGRMVYEKNYPRMLSVWKDVVRKHPDWVLDIYGDGMLRGEVETMIQTLKLQENVVLHGETDNVAEAYCRGSIYLMTSRSEGFPLVLIEAMGCGLPVVAFDCKDGPRDVVEDGVTGRLIPYEEDATMVQALGELMDSIEIREKMGQAAYAASAKWSPDNIMPQWVTLLQGDGQEPK